MLNKINAWSLNYETYHYVFPWSSLVFSLIFCFKFELRMLGCICPLHAIWILSPAGETKVIYSRFIFMIVSALWQIFPKTAHYFYNSQYLIFLIKDLLQNILSFLNILFFLAINSFLKLILTFPSSRINVYLNSVGTISNLHFWGLFKVLDLVFNFLVNRLK